nr:MFS transporter [Bacillus subtilis]
MKNSGSIQESTSSTGISVLIVLALGFLMATLDVTVVNVAMADMKNTLSMSLSGVTWVVDGYILTFASLLLAGGALADRFGSKTIYILGLAVFVLVLLFMRCIYKWTDADCRTPYTGNWRSFVYAKLTQPFGCLLP